MYYLEIRVCNYFATGVFSILQTSAAFWLTTSKDWLNIYALMVLTDAYSLTKSTCFITVQCFLSRSIQLLNYSLQFLSTENEIYKSETRQCSLFSQSGYGIVNTKLY